MRFIVKSDFRKTPGVETEGALLHPDHIHTGCYINIGKAATIEELAAESTQSVMLVAQLNAANRICDASDPKAVKWVEGLVAAEKKRQAVIEKTAPQPTAAK